MSKIIMRKFGLPNDKNIGRTVEDILKSRARSHVYIYLLRNDGLIKQDIIQGTKLHTSTVRELLSKMFNEKQVYRKKRTIFFLKIFY